MQMEVGSVVEGKVTGIAAFGAFVELEDGKTGLVHISEVASEYVSNISEHLKEGQNVKVKIISMDNGKISLSIKRAAENFPEKKEERRKGERNRQPHHASKSFDPKNRPKSLSLAENAAICRLMICCKNLNRTAMKSFRHLSAVTKESAAVVTSGHIKRCFYELCGCDMAYSSCCFRHNREYDGCFGFHWMAIGAFAAATAAFLGFGTTAQIFVFAVVSAIMLVLTAPLSKKFRQSKKVSTNADRLIGQEGIVLRRIDPIENKGQIKVMGQVWSAEGIDGCEFNVGEKVVVRSIEGVHVMVEGIVLAERK